MPLLNAGLNLCWPIRDLRNVAFKEVDLFPPRIKSLPQSALVVADVERGIGEEATPCPC